MTGVIGDTVEVTGDTVEVTGVTGDTVEVTGDTVGVTGVTGPAEISTKQAGIEPRSAALGTDGLTT